MGFFSGRVSFLRFQVGGSSPRQFDAEHLERLADRKAGRQRIASADGIEVGWTAGEHVLDTDFQLAKNCINDTLAVELRIDTDKLPADLLRAYTAVELKARAKKKAGGKKTTARSKGRTKSSARRRKAGSKKKTRRR